MLNIALLGASGSIGTQTLDVCRKYADKVKLVAIAVKSSLAFAIACAHEFDLAYVVIAESELEKSVAADAFPEHTRVLFGTEHLSELCELDEVDCVVNALVGAVGISAGHAALACGKRLAYANKESIVIGGDLLMPLAAPGQLIPVDSEHSAIFQCLTGEPHEAIYKIWLTCSGGPFFGMSRAELAHVTAADALAHPTWLMGDKITIDSATLMNKGLEIIEAHHLFDVPIDTIEVLVHRQSKIHSMVEFSDGSVKANLCAADMRMPIQYALSYPDRWEAACEHLDWHAEAPLEFARVDTGAFGCLALAQDAGRAGGTAPCILNAANEVANEAFRAGRCSFLDVERIVAHTLEHMDALPVESLEQLASVDAKARSLAARQLER